jgi:hypothetical protein
MLLAQTKVEIEKRVARNKVPEDAVAWLEDAYKNASNVKWYYEQNSDKESYEAKFKWKHQWHSVEFTTNGKLEDIEIAISWESIAKDTREQIETAIREEFQSFKIKKIQKQLSGDEDDLKDAIDEEELNDVTIRYEIIFIGKTATKKHLWEGTFSKEGLLLTKRRVLLRASDNLNY